MLTVGSRNAASEQEAFLSAKIEVLQNEVKERQDKLDILEAQRGRLVHELEEALTRLAQKEENILHLNAMLDIPTLSTQRFGEGVTELHITQFPHLELEWVQPLLLNDGSDNGHGKYIFWRPLPKLKVAERQGFVPLCVSYCVVKDEAGLDVRNVHHKVLYLIVSGGGERWHTYTGAVIACEEPWKQIPQTLQATSSLFSSLSSFIQESPQLQREVNQFKFPAASVRPIVAEYVDRHVCERLHDEALNKQEDFGWRKGKLTEGAGPKKGSKHAPAVVEYPLERIYQSVIKVPVESLRPHVYTWDAYCQTDGLSQESLMEVAHGEVLAALEDMKNRSNVAERRIYVDRVVERIIEVPVPVEKIVEKIVHVPMVDEDNIMSQASQHSSQQVDTSRSVHGEHNSGSGTDTLANNMAALGQNTAHENEGMPKGYEGGAAERAGKKWTQSELKKQAIAWVLAEKKDREIQTDYVEPAVKIQYVPEDRPVVKYVPIEKVVEKYVQVPVYIDKSVDDEDDDPLHLGRAPYQQSQNQAQMQPNTNAKDRPSSAAFVIKTPRDLAADFNGRW